MSREYIIRYGLVRARDISDRVLVKNPQYGVGIGGYGSRSVKPDTAWYRKLEQESKFYTRLEESMLREGVRNPIFCNSIPEGTFCRYGTSRLWIARKHDLIIPMIIADYVDRWLTLTQLVSEEAIRAHFKDQPEVVELGDDEMRIDSCPHHHLKDD